MPELNYSCHYCKRSASLHLPLIRMVVGCTIAGTTTRTVICRPEERLACHSCLATGRVGGRGHEDPGA